MTAAKTPKVPADPGEALKAALANLVTAAAAYAAADTGRTTHSFTADGFRIRFMGEELSSVVPM